jgi:hypothetical protein
MFVEPDVTNLNVTPVIRRAVLRPLSVSVVDEKNSDEPLTSNIPPLMMTLLPILNSPVIMK